MAALGGCRRFLLNATLPRVFQRRILRILAPELGQYLVDAGRGFRLAGELGVVGPALSSLDAPLAYQSPPPSAAWSAKDAKRAATQAAAAQEARSMLGQPPSTLGCFVFAAPTCCAQECIT